MCKHGESQISGGFIYVLHLPLILLGDGCHSIYAHVILHVKKSSLYVILELLNAHYLFLKPTKYFP
jgi:hypothetical protein